MSVNQVEAAFRFRLKYISFTESQVPVLKYMPKENQIIELINVKVMFF